MKERFFTDLNEMCPIGLDMEADRVFDVRDPKWAHPILSEGWNAPELGASVGLLSDPRQTMEQKAGAKAEVVRQLLEILAGNGRGAGEGGSACDVEEFNVPGCPEEPETSARVLVYRPKTNKKRHSRVFYYVLGGALTLNDPEFYPLEEFAARYNTVMVVTHYRTSLEAPYPAAINDLHAGYEWMLGHADEIGVNADNTVLIGLSSGGHLALSLGFRLKRYGIIPKGVVAMMPQTDDRDMTSASQIYTGMWDAPLQHNAMLQWLGANYASGTVGPEALPNHATVEDCIGYPPCFIHTVEFDPDRDNSRELASKMLEAHTFCEFHLWAGAHHVSSQVMGTMQGGEPNEYGTRLKTILDANIEDCFGYDLRRPWVREDAKKAFLAKLGFDA